MNKLTIISASIAARIQAFIGTEPTRYYLNGFAVQPHPVKGAYVVATDGRRLGVFYDEGATVAESCIVKLSKDAVKACKAKSSAPMAVYIDHASDIAYVAAHLSEDSVMPSNLTALPLLACVSPQAIIDGTFPDWPRVCPAAPVDDCTKYTWLNSKYLAAFGTVSQTQKAANVGVYAAEPTSPAWVFVSGVPEFVGVLIPMRNAAAPTLPSWLFPKAEKSAKAAD